MPSTQGIFMEDANGRPHVARETQGALVQELAMSLERGYWRVAIRRFLMLEACGFDIPGGDRKACEALLSSCPAADLRRIRDRVQSWVDMLAPPELQVEFEHLGSLHGAWSSLIVSVTR